MDEKQNRSQQRIQPTAHLTAWEFREFAANERQIVATLKERSQAQGKISFWGYGSYSILSGALFHGSEIA